MPDKTQQIAVDAVGQPEQIVPNTACRRIVVFESAQAGTVGFRIRRPLSTSGYVEYAPGTKAKLTPGGEYHQNGYRTFPPGMVAAYIETVSGSANFNVIEDSEE